MRKTLLFTFSFLLSITTFSQCPVGNIGLMSQADIDNFASDYPGCTQLTNALGISGANVTNLNGLSQIEEIGTGNGGFGGSLIISQCPGLTSLSGLDNLTFIGGTIRITTTGITNFNGLGSLENVRGDLSIDNNPNLVDLTGLDALAFANGIQANNNDQLINFNGLGTVSAEFFPEDITIFSNLSLQNLDGLEGWQQIRNFIIQSNPLISSIDAAADMELLGTFNVVITGNPNLSSCSIDMVCNSFLDPGITHIINTNASGCNSPAKVEAQCDLGVEEVSLQNMVVIWPNPVSEIIRIKPSANVMQLSTLLHSVTGELLRSTSETTIDVSNLSEGIYFVNITTEHGTVTHKVVKAETK